MKRVSKSTDGCEMCGDPIPKGQLEIRYPTGAIIDSLFLCSDCADEFDEEEEEARITREEEEAEYRAEMEHIYDAIEYEKWYIYEVMGMSEWEAKYG